MKPKLLITGGSGDLAHCLRNELSNNYEVESPEKGVLDVSKQESVEKYFAERSFDVVINAAGVLYSSPLLESEESAWGNAMLVNLYGTYLVTRHALAKNKDTKIINIASTSAYNHYADWSSYCSTKSAVLSFTRCIYKEGFNAICLCPGAIATKMRDGLGIVNNNVMTVTEGAAPILDAVGGKYDAGDVVFYRKNFMVINPQGPEGLF